MDVLYTVRLKLIHISKTTPGLTGLKIPRRVSQPPGALYTTVGTKTWNGFFGMCCMSPGKWKIITGDPCINLD